MGYLKNYVFCGAVLGLVNIFFLPSRRKHEMVLVKLLKALNVSLQRSLALTGCHLITQDRLGTRITRKKEILLAPKQKY